MLRRTFSERWSKVKDERLEQKNQNVREFLVFLLGHATIRAAAACHPANGIAPIV